MKAVCTETERGKGGRERKRERKRDRKESKKG